MSETKRLYRSRTDRGGIAEYFDIDPIIVRLITVVLLFAGGVPGVLPYLVLWVVVPERPKNS